MHFLRLLRLLQYSLEYMDDVQLLQGQTSFTLVCFISSQGGRAFSVVFFNIYIYFLCNIFLIQNGQSNLQIQIIVLIV